MTASSYPWEQLHISSKGNYNKLRVQGTTHLSLFWLRDDKGKPGLLIEISQKISVNSLTEAKINIRDLSIDVVDFPSDNLRAIVIILENIQNQDIFNSLCLDLVDHVSSQNKDYETFQLVCSRLKKWQAFLAGRTRHTLSLEEIQGLYAELSFIAGKLDKDLASESFIIDSWMGPDSAQQDFILNNTAVEIKSVKGSDRDRIRISSEHQLTTFLDQLYLVVYFLSINHAQDSQIGENLNEIVKRILNQIVTNKVKDLFEEKLAAAGYIHLAEYNSPRFQIKAVEYYRVIDQFPRITQDSLPVGIKQVSYDIELSSIARFRVAKI
jgi:hypothetical protein